MTRMPCFHFFLSVLFLAVTGCTGSPGPEGAGDASTRSETIIEPLPRIVDNSPGENHFDTLVQLTDGGVNRRPVFIDNDRSVAFASQRPPHADQRSYRMFSDASGLKQVEEELPRAAVTAASPSGEIRCLTVLQGGSADEIYGGVFPPPAGTLTEVILTMGTGDTKIISAAGQLAGSPTVTPDGRYVVYCGEFSEGQFDLYVYTIESGLNEKITTAEGFDGDPSFSSDGRRLLFVSQRNDPDPAEYNLFAADWLLIQEE